MAFNTGIVTKESARRVLGSANKNNLMATSTSSSNNYGWSNGVFNEKPDTTTTINDPIRAKAIAYLKEYVGQMRAAGFPDYNIRKKLEKIGSINIPNNLPANFGQTGVWTQGMADEFRMAAMSGGTKTNTQQALEDWVPSPDEYLTYMPGYKYQGIPDLNELKELSNSTGKFSKTKYENLRNALQEYIANYDGPTVPVNNDTLKAGVAGLPLDIGQQYYQEYYHSLVGNEENTQAQQEYEDLLMNYPEITTFTPGASAEENAAKIREYYEGVKQQEQQNELRDYARKAAEDLYDDWQNAKSDGEYLLGTIKDADGKTDIDVFEKILQDIRIGKSIDEVFNWIEINNIPVNKYELAGLYYLNGK